MKKLILAFSIFLTACTSMPAKQGPLNQKLTWPQREAQLNQIEAWTVHGAIGGAALTANNQPQSFSASVVWEQNKNHFDMHLFGPLGVGMTQLIGTATNLTLITSKGQRIQANDPETLLQQELNWSLPVSNLIYWVRGLPAPNMPAEKQFDQYHHVTELKQQGWTIDYLHYTAVNGRYDLPSKIVMQRPNLALRLVISAWQL